MGQAPGAVSVLWVPIYELTVLVYAIEGPWSLTSCAILLVVEIRISILIWHSWDPKIRRLPVSILIELSLEPALMKLESLLLHSRTSLCDLRQVTSSLWPFSPTLKNEKQNKTNAYFSPSLTKSTAHLPKLKNKKVILCFLRLSPSNRVSHGDGQCCRRIAFLWTSGF